MARCCSGVLLSNSCLRWRVLAERGRGDGATSEYEDITESRNNRDGGTMRKRAEILYQVNERINEEKNEIDPRGGKYRMKWQKHEESRTRKQWKGCDRIERGREYRRIYGMYLSISLIFNRALVCAGWC